MNWNELKFKAEDFACGCGVDYNCDEIAGKKTECYARRNASATLANCILAEKLERAPEVFAHDGSGFALLEIK